MLTGDQLQPIAILADRGTLLSLGCGCFTATKIRCFTVTESGCFTATNMTTCCGALQRLLKSPLPTNGGKLLFVKLISTDNSVSSSQTKNLKKTN